VRYDITLAPWIQTGEIGWCEQTTRGAAIGCSEGVPMPGSPIVGPSSIGGGLPAVGRPAPGEGLSVVFTAPQVAAVRVPHGPTVLTRAFASLPYGYRAAVFEFNPRLPRGGGIGAQLTFLRATRQVIALDSLGRRIAANSSGPPNEPTVPWSPSHQPVGKSCSLAAKQGTNLELGVGTVVPTVTAAPEITGQAFLPCLSTDLDLVPSHPVSTPSANLGIMQAAILLNAKDPGAPAAALPNVSPLPGHPAMFNNPDLQTTVANTAGLTATRVGNAWLVVAGGHGTAQRVAALVDLIVGPLDLRPSARAPAGSAGALCRIGYRQTAGIQETVSNAITSLTGLRPDADAIPSRATVDADLARLKAAEAATPQNNVQLARDQAKLALDEQAEFINNPQTPPFLPNCASASFYYHQQLPMTATVLLSTRKCVTPVPLSPCPSARPIRRQLSAPLARQHALLAHQVKAVPGHPNEFTAPLLDGGSATIRRYSRWWLVITGGQRSQQEQLLSQLTATVAPTVIGAVQPRHRRHRPRQRRDQRQANSCQSCTSAIALQIARGACALSVPLRTAGCRRNWF
jgi:hypothetical protein